MPQELDRTDALAALLDGDDEGLRAFLRLLSPAELDEALGALEPRDRGVVLLSLDERERVEFLESLAAERVAEILTDVAPQAVGDLLEELDDEVVADVFAQLELEEQADVLRAIEDVDVREELIESIPDAELADIAELSRSDDAADLLDELTDERAGRVLGEMEAQKRAEIEQLQQYAEDSAGGIMQTELIKLGGDLTVQQAIEVVRRDYNERIGAIYDLYVVDDDGHLLGRVRNRHLVVSPPDVRIADVMFDDVLSVPEDMDQEDIADLVADYDVASIAVVDRQKRLIGRILVDDIVDVLEEEATEDMAKMAGTGTDDIHSRSVLRTVRARLPWLATTFVAGLGSMFLIASLEDQVLQVKAAGAAVPIIAGMSGNVGTQASSVTVRGIAVGEIDFGDLAEVIWKEVLSGLVFAMLFGFLLFVYVLYGLPMLKELDPVPGATAVEVALVPAVAILITIVTGATTGTLVPLTLDRLGRDPAVASSPFISTVNDLVGISVLALIVKLLLQ